MLAEEPSAEQVDLPGAGAVAADLEVGLRPVGQDLHRGPPGGGERVRRDRPEHPGAFNSHASRGLGGEGGLGAHRGAPVLGRTGQRSVIDLEHHIRDLPDLHLHGSCHIEEFPNRPLPNGSQSHRDRSGMSADTHVRS